MGLIREPKNVDFTVLDKPWSDEERKEFSAYIKLKKGQRKKHKIRTKPTEPGSNGFSNVKPIGDPS